MLLEYFYSVSRDRSYYFAIKHAKTREFLSRKPRRKMERPQFHYYLNYTYNYAISYRCVSYSLNISEKGDFGLKCMPEVDDTV